MPISATENRTEKHWANVQTLLHRAIQQAGIVPVNVWSGEVIDRISERIVGNIFAHEIVVADISELNPNVMLELGLRLASKRPTIVIANEGGEIPFDIRDFHVLQYPSDLSILAMEEFIELLVGSLKAKLTAYDDGSYEPFLGKVVVDVASPETRAVPMNDLILERLDDIAKRVSRTEVRSPFGVTQNAFLVPKKSSGPTYRTTTQKSTAFFTVPAGYAQPVSDAIAQFYTTVTIIASDDTSAFIAASSIPPRSSDSAVEVTAASLIRNYGGVTGAPEAITKHYA